MQVERDERMTRSNASLRNVLKYGLEGEQVTVCVDGGHSAIAGELLFAGQDYIEMITHNRRYFIPISSIAYIREGSDAVQS